MRLSVSKRLWALELDCGVWSNSTEVWGCVGSSDSLSEESAGSQCMAVCHFWQ